MAKNWHFGNILKVFGDNVRAYLVLSKNLSLLWAISAILIVANGLVLTNNLAIWSHCLEVVYPCKKLAEEAKITFGRNKMERDYAKGQSDKFSTIVNYNWGPVANLINILRL